MCPKAGTKEETKQIAAATEASKDNKGMLSKLALGLFCGFLFLCAFFVIIWVEVMAANDASKDFRPDGSGTLTGIDGQVMSAGVHQQSGERWHTAVGGLGSALSSPDTQVCQPGPN